MATPQENIIPLLTTETINDNKNNNSNNNNNNNNNDNNNPLMTTSAIKSLDEESKKNQSKPLLYGSASYIHGLTDQDTEFERLKRQGRMLAPHLCPLIARKSIQLNSDKPILEMGCGVGAQTRTIHDLFPENRMICVDREASYLKQFRKDFSFEMQGITTQQIACMTKLPYPDNDMSAAVIIHVLEHNSPTDRINILKEARRVVKQGGVVIIAECDLREIYTGHPQTCLNLIKKTTYPHTLAFMKAYLKAQEEVPGDGTIGCHAKMKPLLHAAGFQEGSFTHEPIYLTSHGQQYFIDLLETVKHVVVGRGGSFEEMKKEIREQGRNIFYVNYLVVAKVDKTEAIEDHSFSTKM